MGLPCANLQRGEPAIAQMVEELSAQPPYQRQPVRPAIETEARLSIAHLGLQILELVAAHIW